MGFTVNYKLIDLAIEKNLNSRKRWFEITVIFEETHFYDVFKKKSLIFCGDHYRLLEY